MIKNIIRNLALGSLFFTLISCGDSNDKLVFPQPLTQQVMDVMDTAIQDEYRAENIYLKVLEDFGTVQPFHNIVNAEERHSSAIARLHSSRGLEVPASEWTLDNVPAFASVAEACAAGVGAEIKNIELYDEFLKMELPSDVQIVFQNNRRASLENHLPAFQNCSGN